MAYREHIQEQLSAYIDGELSETEARNVSSAIEADPLLAQELQKLRSVRQLYRTSDVQHAPRGFTDRVLNAVEREELMKEVVTRQAMTTPFWKKSLAVAAVTLLAAGIGIILVTGPDWFARDGQASKDTDTDVSNPADPGRQDPASEVAQNPPVSSIDDALAWMGSVTVATIMADNPQITSANVEDILIGSGAKAVSASSLKSSASDAELNTICFTVRETSTGVVYVATGSKEHLAALKLSLRNQLSTRFIDISKAAASDRSELASILDVMPPDPGSIDTHDKPSIPYNPGGTDLAKDTNEKTEQEKFREMSERFQKYLPKRNFPTSDKNGATSEETARTDDSSHENPTNGIQAIYIKVIKADW